VDCPNCGALVAGERSPRFCSECGGRLRNDRRGLIIAIVVLLTVAGIAATAAVNSTRDRTDVAATSTSAPRRTVTPQAATATPFPAEATAVAGGPRPSADALAVEVTRVVDGDTVALFGLEIGKRDGRSSSRLARLIGIDTPEVSSGGECYGREASEFTKRSLLGKRVFIDVERVDRFGRALVYIWEPEGAFFNARLAAEGFAQQLTIPPNVRYAELFSTLVREAREQNHGLWSGCEMSAPFPSP
jgi:micrococcal nuclease